jgi:4-amino-4-deoxy-L-arabinose transferase-like glycosyltransferase
MFRLQSRPAHYAVLALIQLALTLPNIGNHTLWDMDEGVNAEAGREMFESGNWITPYFNYEIRTAKPALLYWLEAASFSVFGVNEFAARLPAVLCGLGSVLFTYELGRRMFSPATGLLSGIALATCVEFCLISHAATPDPPLILFLSGVYFFYWAGSEGDRRWWFVPCGAMCGLATLAKGPVGLGLPGLVVLLHLTSIRRLYKLWDRRFVLGALAFIAVAAPWYVMVTLDSRGVWPKAFFLNENFQRFRTPAEGHRGQYWYHVVLLFVLFAPWSTFLIPSVWQASREARQRPPESGATDTTDKYRFLLVWFLTYLVFFSLAATKLPNYVLPLYPAIAIITARWLDRWRTGELPVHPWVMTAAAAGCVAVGLAVGLGLVLLGGTITLPVHDKTLGSMPALGPLAWIGLIPVVIGLWFWWQARRDRRTEAIATFAAGAALFLGLLGVSVPKAMDEYKAPRFFAEKLGLRQTDRDIRIATYDWFRHSIVFYVGREVTPLKDLSEVEPFLALPRPAYLIVPEDTWYDPRAPKLTTPVKVIGSHYDFYARKNVLVVANQYAVPD